MSFAPKRSTAFKISENNFGYFYFKIPSFIYLCLLVETLQRIKVRVLQNFEDFEDFCIEAFMQIHLMMQNSSNAVGLLGAKLIVLIPLGIAFCLRIVIFSLNIQNLLLNAFLPIFEWYLYNK